MPEARPAAARRPPGEALGTLTSLPGLVWWRVGPGGEIRETGGAGAEGTPGGDLTDQVHPEDRLVLSRLLADPHPAPGRPVTLRLRRGATGWQPARLQVTAQPRGGDRLVVATLLAPGPAVPDPTVEESGVVSAALAACPDLLTIADPQGRLHQHGQQASRLARAVASIRWVRDLQARIHPEDRPGVQQAFAALRSGESDEIELRYRLREVPGRWLVVETRGRADRGPDGRLRAVLALTRDITAAVAAEQRLRQATAEAEAAGEARSELLSRLSHELRTPLNAVLGFAQLLGLEQLEASQAARVEEIGRAASDLTRLVDDLLDLVRLETGRADLHLEPLEVAEVARPLAVGRSLELRADPHLPAVLADRRRLVQVLHTLVLALGVQEEQPVTVWALAGPGDRVRLAVEASEEPPAQGPLIESAPGHPGPAPWSGGPSGTPGARGTGGLEVARLRDPATRLALARYLVGQMGGRLEVVGDPVVRFELDLPAARSSAGPPSTPDRAPRSRTRRLEVLVLSDDAALVGLVTATARRRPGVRVRQASPFLGTQAARAAHPGADLLLVDLAALQPPEPSAPTAQRTAPQRTAPRRTGPVGASRGAEHPDEGGPVVVGVGHDDQAGRRLVHRGVLDAFLRAPLDARALLELLDAQRAESLVEEEP